MLLGQLSLAVGWEHVIKIRNIPMLRIVEVGSNSKTPANTAFLHGVTESGRISIMPMAPLQHGLSQDNLAQHRQ
jgi:hypothetical protein